MAELSHREAWASDDDYRAYLATLKRLDRLEAEARQTAKSKPKRKRRKIKRRRGQTYGAARYAAKTRSERVEAQIYHKRWLAAWKAEDPEGFVAYWRDVSRRCRERNPERTRANKRASYYRNLPHNLLKALIWRTDNHDRKLEYMRDYLRAINADPVRQEEHRVKKRASSVKLRDKIRDRMAVDPVFAEQIRRGWRDKSNARHASKPGYVGRDARMAAAYELEDQVFALRAEGWKWLEVGELTDRPMSTCVNAYKRAKKRAERDGEQKSA